MSEPIPYPWAVAEYRPCGIYFHKAWRSRVLAEGWALYMMMYRPCTYARAVPLPYTGGGL